MATPMGTDTAIAIRNTINNDTHLLVRASSRSPFSRGGLSGVRHSLLQEWLLPIEVHDMKHDLLDAAEDTQAEADQQADVHSGRAPIWRGTAAFRALWITV